MLFWQHKSTHNQLVAWLKLGSIVSLVHVIVLFLLFFMYQDGISNLFFLVASSKMHQEIVFSIAIEEMPKKTQPAKVASKKPAAVPSKKTATVATPKKTITPLPQIKKEKAPPVAPKKKEIPVPVVTKELDHLDMQVAANKKIHGFEQECAALYHDIASYWAPPSGVPADCTCKITVFIDREGSLADMNVDTSSGMLVYDLAARATMSELAFPRFTWGKSITITFTV